MKIATLEVDGMLSALSLQGLEWPRRGLRGVAGASRTYATGNVTGGHDEARVEIADAKATPVPASAEAAHADATAWPGRSAPDCTCAHDTADAGGNANRCARAQLSAYDYAGNKSELAQPGAGITLEFTPDRSSRGAWRADHHSTRNEHEDQRN